MNINRIVFSLIIIPFFVFSQSRKTNYINDLIIYDKLTNENLLLSNDNTYINGFIKGKLVYRFDKPSMVEEGRMYKINFTDTIGRLVLSHEVLDISEKEDMKLHVQFFSLNKSLNKKITSQILSVLDSISNRENWQQANQFQKNIEDVDGAIGTFNVSLSNGLYNFFGENKLTSHTYDEKKRIISIKKYYESGVNYEVCNFFYDDNNRITRKIILEKINPEKQTGEIKNVCIYVYDNNSNLIKVLNSFELFDQEGMIIFYDNNNQITKINKVVSGPIHINPYQKKKLDFYKFTEKDLSIEGQSSTTYKYTENDNFKVISTIENAYYGNDNKVYFFPKYLTKYGMEKYHKAILDEKNIKAKELIGFLMEN